MHFLMSHFVIFALFYFCNMDFLGGTDTIDSLEEMSHIYIYIYMYENQIYAHSVM